MQIQDKAKAAMDHIRARIAQLEAAVNSCAGCAARRARIIEEYKRQLAKLTGK